MLTPEQIQFYKDNGYLLVEKVFTAEEIDECVRETDAMFERVQQSGRRLEATWGGKWREAQIPKEELGKTSVLSIHNMQYHSAVFTRMLVHPKLTEVLADLIGPNVQLHHTKLHVKPPEKGSPFPLHQDYDYFPHEKDTMTAAVIHLEDATVESGCLCVLPGSHKLGPLGHQHEGSHYLSPDEYPIEKATPCPAKAGDVLLFTYLTVHGSYLNRTHKPRRIALFQFRSPTDRPLKDVHVSPGQGMMVRGINPVP
ncbi:phytanoyl-CoA dioxygenase family protein [Candidatus Poribacteria bacterium]|nr:phytanoyl-CoA dioxygenase family protein [Candidatus Poribacteria bacterium]